MANDWWRGAVMYQVYPRSYKDTNGDGIGDLKGITGRMNYIASLNVEGIWLSPCFQSPMKDFGYDISDYRAIDPMFGTMDDFDDMLRAAHARGLKVIIDQVYSHTSDMHPWFLESRKSRDNSKADWYVWADPNPANPDDLPNNWVSVFGGPAWRFCEERGQFYLHNFLSSQPDLNFHNPDVQNEILETAQFWLERGVDGHRLDVVNFYFHDALLRDNPPKEETGRFATQLEIEDDPYNMQRHVYDKSRPEMAGFLQRLRALSERYPGRMYLGEIGDDDPVQLAATYTSGSDMLHTAYSFALMAGARRALTASYIRGAVEDHLAQPGDSWPSWAFSNHDVVRAVTRFGKDGAAASPALAKLLIAVLCSLRGTAFLYQGEELGLPEARIPEDIPVDQMRDPWGIALYPKAPGRDGCRTPMPWDDGAHAGFSDAGPWLPVPDSHKVLNAAAQDRDPGSTLQFTRAFLKWRRAQEALIIGDIEFLETGSETVLGFVRTARDQKFWCYFNLSPESQAIQVMQDLQTGSGFAFAGMEGVYAADSQRLTLPPYGLFFSS